MKRILIADDHPAVRNGLKYMLLGEFPGAEFGEATNSTEVLGKVDEGHWDILILDLDLPGRNGFEVLEYFKSQNIKMRVLVFSFHREEQVAIRALRLGAAGYLAKDTADRELMNAVNKILSGGRYISSAVSEQLIQQLENPYNQEPHELLSDREFQTLLLLAKGNGMTEVADQLSLSISTVNTYRSRILQKMRIRNNTELIRYAIEHKLI